MANRQGFAAILDQMWHDLTIKTAQLLNADRSTIFLLDKQNNQLRSIAKDPQTGHFQEIHIPADTGIVGMAVTFNKTINIPFDPNPQNSHTTDYPTYTQIALPVFHQQQALIGVVQLTNKLKPNPDRNAPLSEQIDQAGFTPIDEAQFAQWIPLITPLLEKYLPSEVALAETETAPQLQPALEQCQILSLAAEKQRQQNALLSALKTISQSNLDVDETIQILINEAKKVVKADRCTLWILDRERNQLWTKIPLAGTFKEIRLPMGAGFAGRVASTGQTLNIAFDLYEHPDSELIKQTDRSVGYRSCSLLSVPLFDTQGEVLGVTHLINKQRDGEYPPYDPDHWPNAPECWKSSFNPQDLELIEAFNTHAACAIKNATRFATIHRQALLYSQILHNLFDGIIATNATGQILAINEPGKHLIGFSESDQLEGRNLCDLIQLPQGNLNQWLQAATGNSSDAQNRLQCYPQQILITASGQRHPINLSLTRLASNELRQLVAGDGKIDAVLLVMHQLPETLPISAELYPPFNQQSTQSLDIEDSLSMAARQASPQSLDKEISILYSGMRGFTPLLENLENGEVSQLLKEYFQSMTEAVFKNKGTIDKYIGDAIIAVFGSSVALRDHAWCAVQTAIEMRQRLVELNIHRIEDGKQALRIGIGINSQRAIAPETSLSESLATTINDAINICSYLEKASKEYGCDIILSQSTYSPCADRVWARELDLIRIKGQNEPVGIYQLLGLRSEEIPEEKVQVIQHYSQGREHYRNQEFSQAAAQFQQVLEISNWDKPAAIQLERCQHWLQSPPPADWDGVWKFTEM